MSKVKHGMWGTPIYRAWHLMKDRCMRSKHKNYDDYGGRGIKVCQEWQNSFVAFYEHVKELPHYGNDGYSLDRIDNDGDYEPGNVQWATHKEQNRNTRRNILLTHNGKTMCVKDWAEEFGMHRKTLALRLQSGYSIEEALTTPLRKIKLDWHKINGAE